MISASSLSSPPSSSSSSSSSSLIMTSSWSSSIPKLAAKTRAEALAVGSLVSLKMGGLCLWLLVLLLTVSQATTTTTTATDKVGPKSAPVIISSHPDFVLASDVLQFTLSCKATGSEPMHYRWRLPTGQESQSGTYSLETFTKDKEGVYKCIATNQYGVAESNETTWLYHKGKCVWDANFIDRRELAINDSMSFRCSTACRPAGTCSYKWFMEPGGVITETDKIRIDPTNGTLHVGYVDEETMNTLRDKKLRCYTSAYRNDGDLVCAEYEIKQSVGKKVAPPSDLPKLWFDKSPKIEGLRENYLTLNCSFLSLKKCEVNWWKKDEANGNWGPVSGELSYSLHRNLVFNSLKLSDSGSYKCDCNGEADHVVELTVGAKPYFESASDMPVGARYSVGEDATVACRVKGEPEPKVEWFIDSFKYDAQRPEMSRIILDDKQKTLTIKNLCKECTSVASKKREDNVVVTCLASNKHAQYRYSAPISVFDKTTINDGPTNHTVNTTDERVLHVFFNCISHVDRETVRKIDWFFLPPDKDVVQPLEASEEKGILINDDKTFLKLEVRNSTDWPNLRGGYRCLVSNGITRAEGTGYLIVNERAIVAPVKKGDSLNWLILAIVAALVLMLILCIIFVWCCYYNRGAEYKVDKKERKSGNKPEEELEKTGFQTYQRPSANALKGSRMSLGSSIKMDSDDEGSLNDYGDIDHPGKFGEDGSFIGEYNTAAKNAANNASGGYPYGGGTINNNMAATNGYQRV